MANTVYDNKIIEAKVKDLLTTSLNTRSLMTVDSELAQSAGMTKTINTYTYSGTAEEVANGQGNTSKGSIAYVPTDYTVKMVQQSFSYTDEDFMKDDSIVDNMLKGANQVMTNKMTADFVAATNSSAITKEVEIAAGAALSYDAIVDGISELNIEDESQVFVVIPYAWKADLRKDDDYKAAQLGAVVYNGQVGTICGIPVVATKALTNKAFVMTKEAITLFIKKEIEVEQERDADTRTNNVYLRDAYLVALTDATKVCKIVKA